MKRRRLLEKKRTLADNIILLMLLSVMLKLVGFVSRAVTAYWFGTDSMTDIYYSATGFIDSISAVVLAGLTVGIVNIYLSKNDTQMRNSFISNLVSLVICVMCVASTVCFLFSEEFSFLLIAECTPQVRTKLITALRILCISFPIQGIISVLGAVLQAEKKFTAVKLTGTITSITNMVCVILLTKAAGINALIISYIVGTVLNASFLLFHVRKQCTIRIQRTIWNEDIKTIISLSAPLMVSMAAHQLNLILDKSIASQVAVGAISALSYSSFLYLCIENIFVQSVATAIFPELSKDALDHEDIQVAKKVNSTIFYTVLILIPIVSCSFIYSELIVKIVYMRGSFDMNSLNLTQWALRGYVIGLPFLVFRDVTTRVYYAYGDTKTPVRVGLIAVAINIFLDIVLSQLLGIFGITVATSCANFMSGLLLYVHAKKINKHILNRKMLREIAVLFLYAVVTIIAAVIFAGVCSSLMAFLVSFAVSILLGLAIIGVFFPEMIRPAKLFLTVRIRKGNE